jgi:hypothetical protein
MTIQSHLSIQNGAEAGRLITVPASGMRVGRGDKNDLVIEDSAMSRHHCRFSFRDGHLCLTDLGSANRCLVNGQGVDEATLQMGDVVTVGDTEFRVECDTMDIINEPAPLAQPLPVVGHVDLGLTTPPPARQDTHKGQTGAWVAVGIVAVVAIATAIIAPRWMNRGETIPLVPGVAAVVPLEIVYEKVNASSSNIVYYRLVLGTDGMVSVQMDDLVGKRHVLPDRKMVDAAIVQSLAHRLIDAGFFTLDEEYRGIRTEGDTLWDLSVTAGRRTHRSRVINRAAPDVFAKAATILEEFCKNELGLWATDVAPDKLIEMADAAYRLGKRLYDERQVKHDNLARALKSYEEAAWYLQTLEPKPEFHRAVVTGIDTLKLELKAQYDEQNFRVERAIRLREWETAQQELQLICESIPDVSDPRHVEARTKLLDVEKHLRTKK